MTRRFAVRQDFAEAHNNRGVTLYRLGRFTEALASYDRAIALGPDRTEAFNNRGVALKELRRIPEALASYHQAQQLAPDYADAHWNEALLRLLIGDFSVGLAKYEWRWKRKNFTSPRRSFREPQWDGSDCRGRTILLYGEQGFGDVIQFCRYVPSVVARGATVILEVAEPLCGLMGSLGAAQVLPSGARLPAIDLHCPLMSLPMRPPLGTPGLVRTNGCGSVSPGPEIRARKMTATARSASHRSSHSSTAMPISSACKRTCGPGTKSC
jgi:hypothetical protein